MVRAMAARKGSQGVHFGHGAERVLVAVGDVICAGVGRLLISYGPVVGGDIQIALEISAPARRV